MQSPHTIGAVKMSTFEGFDKCCFASRSAGCSTAMLDYGQQFQCNAYAQLTSELLFTKTAADNYPSTESNS